MTGSTAFADPTSTRAGIGYNTRQARIAIGSGGLDGQGLFHGAQTQGGFVPYQQTDFVFSVAGEELGFVGAAAILLLEGFVLLRGLLIARRAEELFGRLVAVGVVVLVRLPDLREHRDEPRHHAGDRAAAAVRVLRRLVDVRVLDGHRAAAERRLGMSCAAPDGLIATPWERAGPADRHTGG